MKTFVLTSTIQMDDIVALDLFKPLAVRFMERDFGEYFQRARNIHTEVVEVESDVTDDG